MQFDLTARYVAGPFQFATAGYYYRITELVERYASTPTLFLFRNRGLAELQGVEAEALATLPHGFTLGATAETSRGRDGFDGTPLDDVAPAAASLVVRHSSSTRIASYLRIKTVASHDAAGPSEVPTQSSTIVDAGFRARVTEHLDFVGTLRNRAERRLPVERWPALGVGARAARVADARRGVLATRPLLTLEGRSTYRNAQLRRASTSHTVLSFFFCPPPRSTLLISPPLPLPPPTPSNVEIYLQPFPGPGDRIQVSTGGGGHVRWARNGSELFYIAADQRLASVRVTVGANGTLVLGAPVPLFRIEFDTSFLTRQPYVVSPDGQRFLINAATDAIDPPSITLILNWKGMP